MTMRDDTEAQGDANERANVAELRGWLGDRVADLIAHVGCGDLDARGQCERCNAIRAALAPVARRLASAPPAAPPEDARDSHLDAATWRQAAVYLRNRQKYFEEGDDPRDEFLESASDFDRFAAEAASAAPPDPPGLASLTRSLCEALWDLQSSPDCWCPPDRSCTEPHTEACAEARAVNGAAKRFHLYNELPLAARQSDPPGLADDRCAVCGWPLDPKEQMCRRGNCSMRPMPERAADPARAIAEYSAVWGGMARQTLQRWQEQLAEQIARQSDPPGLVATPAVLLDWMQKSKPSGHTGDEESGVCDEDCERCAWDAASAALLAYDLSAPASDLEALVRDIVAWHDARFVQNLGEPFADLIARCRAALSAPASPAPMPTIQVGDIVESTHADVARVETKMEAELWNDNRDLVVEVYRDPLWRRPAPMPTTGDES